MLEAIIAILILLLVGITYFWVRSNSKSSYLEAEKLSLEKSVSEKESIIVDLGNKRSESESRVIELTTQVARLETERTSLLDKIEKRKQEIDDAKKEFKTEFENVASRIFEANRISVTKDNREQIEGVLKPLKEKLGEFQTEVKDTHKENLKTNATLMEQIRQLTDMNQKLSTDATNLTNALRGESKTQWNWWELVLEDLLERSGLVRWDEYVLQGEGLWLKSETGTSVKPDVLIILPEGKTIVVDSKVSLTDYERHINADEAEKKLHLSKHVGSIKAHIDELAKKDYSSHADLRTPDFVMMFVPIEASLTLALIADGSLFTYAWERKVVLVSPTTLLMSLKTVATLWRHEKQTKNVLEIARIGWQLYDKFIGFLADMDGVKKSLEKSLEIHWNAMGKLKDGRGNMVGTIERLKVLGAKTEKQIEGKYLDDVLEDDVSLVEIGDGVELPA